MVLFKFKIFVCLFNVYILVIIVNVIGKIVFVFIFWIVWVIIKVNIFWVKLYNEEFKIKMIMLIMKIGLWLILFVSFL